MMDWWGDDSSILSDSFAVEVDLIDIEGRLAGVEEAALVDIW